MYRGKVTKVDAKGVYVQTADFGVIGPCQVVGATPDVDDMVLLSDVGSDAMPDLVVVGRLTGKGSAVPGASTSVFDFGAVGDGVTDDTAAVEAAITAAGVGGKVVFPRGVFLVSRTLWPLFGQVWEGTHSPMYANTDDPQATCKIVAAPGFTGRALIERAASVNAVTLHRLCLQGLGDEHATPLDGVHLGDHSWERSWMLHTCTIHGFSGRGITGRLHVFDMRDCHVARNGYGLQVTGTTEAMADVRIYGCQFYYNLHGGLCLDNDKHNGQIMIHGSRFERSGSTPGNPAVNRDPYAVGVRLRRGMNMDMVQCSTDANSGPGLEVIGDSAAGVYTYGLTISDCKFARDGGGDQSAGTQLPGVKIKGANAIFFSSNVTWGEADDSGDGSGLISPYYSVWLENTSGCRVTNAFITAPVAANSLHLEGTNYSLVTDQGVAYQDLVGTGTQAKEIRYRISDPVAGTTVTRWSAQVNPTASGGVYFLARYDAAGAYVDAPLTARWSDGLLLTNQIYAQANAANRTAFEARAASTTPSASYFVLSKSDGSKVFEVQSSGHAVLIRETVTADASNTLTTKGYVDAVKAALAASADFADFQTRVAAL